MRRAIHGSAGLTDQLFRISICSSERSSSHVCVRIDVVGLLTAVWKVTFCYSLSRSFDRSLSRSKSGATTSIPAAAAASLAVVIIVAVAVDGNCFEILTSSFQTYT